MRNSNHAGSALDRAAWLYAAATLTMNSDPDDDGAATNRAWRRLRAAARKFVRAEAAVRSARIKKPR